MGRLDFKKLLRNYLEMFIFAFILIYKNIIFNLELGTSEYNIFGNIGTILIIIGLTLWLRRKIGVLTLVLFNFIVSVFMLSDIVYSRYNNGQVIVTSIFKQFGMVDTVQNAIASLLRFSDLFYVADIAILLPIIIFAFIKYKVKISSSFAKRALSSLTVLLVGVLFVFVAFKNADVNYNSTIGQDQLIGNIGILNFHVYDAYAEVLHKDKISINDAESEKIRLELLKRNSAPVNKELKYTGVSKGNNLIVIQVEALQQNMLGLKVEGKEVTPNLNKFLKRSIYFNNYYSETFKAATSDAEFLSNMSYYPNEKGSIYLNYADNTYESLSQSMKDLGYNTLAMHANVDTYYKRNEMYPKIGYDTFYSKKDYINDEPLGPWGVGDKSFLRQSLEILKKQAEPFNAFIITLSSHFPYDVFENSEDFNVGKLNHTFFGNYIKSIHYADAALGQFLKGLEKSGLMDRSTIALYGDHWAIPNYEVESKIPEEEAVRESGYLGLPEGFAVRWANTFRVPLIIHLPKDKEAGIRTTVGGEIDFFPTIANLFGFRPKYALGSDLLNSKGELVIRNDGYISNGKTIYDKSADIAYDLKTGKQVDKTPFIPNIIKAQKELDLSNIIVQNDLIKYFKSKEVK